MASPQVILRFLRRYVFTTESLILGCLTIVFYQLLMHGSFWWTYLKWRVAKSMQRPQSQRRVSGGMLSPTNTRSFFGDLSPLGNGDPNNENQKLSWDLKKGNAALFAIQGKRNRMEDRYSVVTDLEHTDTSIYGVFDGHGGEFAADFVEKTLFRTIMLRLLKSAVDNSKEDFSDILTQEMKNVDKQLLTILKATSDVSGTTAIVALANKKTLTVANVGDSRGVMCDKYNKVIPLSFDHKPYHVKERKRIEAAGGFVSFVGVWRVAGILATSRAFGDFPLKDQNLLIAEPEIRTFDLEEHEPKFIILATDGLWDFFNNEQAVEFIRVRLHEPDFGAKSMVLQAYRNGSADNITVMVIKL